MSLLEQPDKKISTRTLWKYQFTPVVCQNDRIVWKYSYATPRSFSYVLIYDLTNCTLIIKKYVSTNNSTISSISSIEELCVETEFDLLCIWLAIKTPKFW